MSSEELRKNWFEFLPRLQTRQGDWIYLFELGHYAAKRAFAKYASLQVFPRLPRAKVHLSAQVRRTKKCAKSMGGRCRSKRRHGAGIGGQVRQRDLLHTDFHQLREARIYQGRAVFGRAEEVAVVGRCASKKGGNSIACIRSERGNADEFFFLKEEDEEREQRGTISALYRQSPLVGIENLWGLFLQHKRIPGRLQVSVIWNLAIYDYAQGATPCRAKRCLSFS